MNCSICLKKIKENNKVITDCKHPFHLSCILNNFKINNYSGEKCPICRKPLLTTNNGQITSRYIMAPIRRTIGNTTIGNTTIGNTTIGNTTIVPSFIRYNWPPSENTTMSEERNNHQIFTRLKTRKYRNITEVERSRQLTNYAYLIVSKYSYHKLKENLGLYGLSRRGYRRDALENRLIDYMILDTIGLTV